MADESCDFAVVRALREAGFDVTAIAELTPRAADPAVIEIALRDQRILLAEDKDFGRLVYAQRMPSAGVILIRFPTHLRSELPGTVLRLIRDRAEQLPESFVVVSPRRVRISRVPSGSSDARETKAVDAVLLIGFGGPTAPHEIRPFLANVTRGRSIPPERLEAVARHYEAMPGGRSPLNDLTFAQARALERALEAARRPLPVHVGMRNWHPLLDETLAEMAGRGARRALGVILSALRTEASWDRYVEDVAAARERVPNAPEVVFAPPWASHRGYIAAVVDRARQAMGTIPEAERAWTPLVFTAHSVPLAMVERSPYVDDLLVAAHAVVEALGHHRFSIAYQSRSGSPHERWLEPDVNEVIKSLATDGERHVTVVPIGFVADHVEVLYDLDVAARANAEAAGLAFHRAAAVNDHPEFIAALADVVLKAAA